MAAFASLVSVLDGSLHPSSSGFVAVSGPAGAADVTRLSAALASSSYAGGIRVRGVAPRHTS